MLVFEERGKPEYPGKNLSEQSREPTNSTHIWRRIRESIPGHISGRRVLSPLRQPCSPNWCADWWRWGVFGLLSSAGCRVATRCIWQPALYWREIILVMSKRDKKHETARGKRQRNLRNFSEESLERGQGGRRRENFNEYRREFDREVCP